MKLETRGLFVTGTDTGVGKTLVAAAWVSLWRGRGLDTVPMKPVQTGAVLRYGRWMSPDLDRVLALNALQVPDDERRQMAPCCFPTPCSPHLAARRARKPIQLSTLVRAFEALAARHDRVVVEGAGGVRVPLSDRHTMLDLMQALRLPVVLVARPGLGTLNHTLLSLAALRDAGLTVAGVVVCATRAGRFGPIERDNIRTLRRLGKVCVAVLPFMPNLRADAPGRARLARAARRAFGLWA